MNWLLILIVIGVLVTGGIMFMGVASMSQGGKFDDKNSNKFMQARVVAQFATLILVVLYLYLYT
ncbi:MAG: hypothetical protein COB54_02870 [Alphaproteobacteria bacterium]|nr:MAG: hypothetical protein COB54_02870 [Alphaproteobacteria bacterium]